MATTPVLSNGQSAAQLAETAGVSQEELMSQNQAQNPDTMVGSALMARNKSAVTDSSSAKAELDTFGSKLDTAEKDILGQTGTIVSDAEARRLMNNLGNDATGFSRLSDGSWSYDSSVATKINQASNANNGQNNATDATSGLTPAQQKYFDQAKQLAEDRYKQETDEINRLTGRGVAQAEEAGRQAKGSSMAYLARLGSMGTTTAGMQYVQGIEAKWNQKVQDIRTDSLAALEKARTAKSEADFKTLGLMLDQIDKNKENLLKEQKTYQESIKTSLEIAKLERDDLSSTMDALAGAGIEPDDEYFDSADQALGLNRGVSKGIYNLAKEERSAKKSKTAFEQASTLTNILKNVPVGQPVKIGSATYYGTGTDAIEIDEEGNGYYFYANPQTGDISKRDLGYVGKKEDGWTFQKDEAGMPFFVNARTKQIIPATPNETGWDEIVPAGKYADPNFKDANGNPLGLQCGSFVNRVAGVTVGNTLKEKMSRMDKSLTWGVAATGDVIVEDVGGATGHVAVINRSVYKDGQLVGYQVSEANKAGSGVVTHDRVIPVNSPAVKGFIEGKLTPEFQTGTDNSTWVSKISSNNTSSGSEEVETAKRQILASKYLTQAQRNQIIELANTDGIEGLRRWAYSNKLSPSQRTDFDLYDNTQSAFESALSQMDADAIKAGPYKNLAESARPWLGIQRDKAYTDLRGIIEQGQAQLRKGYYGTAVTGTEAGNAKQFLITNNDDIDTIRWKLEQGKNFLRFINDASVNRSLGLDKPDISQYIQASRKVLIGPDGNSYDASAYSDAEIQEAVASGYKLK
jgi:hypothetical protein